MKCSDGDCMINQIKIFILKSFIHNKCLYSTTSLKTTSNVFQILVMEILPVALLFGRHVKVYFKGGLQLQGNHNQMGQNYFFPISTLSFFFFKARVH